MESNQTQNGTPDELVLQVEALRQRIYRLEDAVATLHDTSLLEERLAVRVSERVNGNATRAPSPTAALIIDAGRHLLPAAIPGIPGETPPMALLVSDSHSRPAWFLFDLAAEFRAIFRMFFDPRFRLTWAGRLVPLGVLVAIILSAWTLGSIPLVGWLLDRLADVVLIAIAYKVLSREARRYRALVAAAGPLPGRF
jgi:hypothetical protein